MYSLYFKNKGIGLAVPMLLGRDCINNTITVNCVYSELKMSSRVVYMTGIVLFLPIVMSVYVLYERMHVSPPGQSFHVRV